VAANLPSANVAANLPSARLSRKAAEKDQEENDG